MEISLLRSALYKAVHDAGPAGLSHEILTQKVFDALDLPVELYAVEPGVRFAAAAETKRALRDVLGYRLYRDLRRGLAGDLAQPGAVRAARDPLPVARRGVRSRGRVG